MQALEKMNNFTLAGREVCLHDKAHTSASDLTSRIIRSKSVWLRRKLPTTADRRRSSMKEAVRRLTLCPFHLEFTACILAGTALNNISRIELMQKLARTDRPAVDLPAAPL